MKRKTYHARKAGNCFLSHSRGIVEGYGFVYDRKAWNALPVAERERRVQEFIKSNEA